MTPEGVYKIKIVYPSRLHKLPPNLEIINRRPAAHMFSIISTIFEYKMKKLPKISKTLGILYTTCHNLARSCFQLWSS